MIEPEIVCVAECEDCGKTLVMDADYITIFVIDGSYTGVTLCSQCERPIVNDIDPELVDTMKLMGVRVLSWMGDGVE